jgi:nicotinate-nucleotide adenylyltransferase
VKIGIFGGAFDPVHRGHLDPVSAVARELALDRVFFVPAGISPFKPGGTRASSHHRVAMLALALQGRTDFTLWLSEVERPGASYTVDTLREIVRAHPEEERFLLMGTDSLRTFPRWKDPRGIADLARLAAFVREPHEREAVLAETGLEPYRKSILIFDSVRVRISSTELRGALSRGESVAGAVPKAVEEYIFKQGLYESSRGAEPA